MKPIVTTEQMRKVEAAEIAKGISESELSDQAAKAIFDSTAEDFTAEDSVLVIAGPGNNGLDAVKIRKLLRESGTKTQLYAWHRDDSPPFDANALEKLLSESTVVLDGLFGIGLTRAVEGDAAEIVTAIAKERERRQLSDSPLRVISIDIPSGLQSDSGEAMGVAVEADITITIELPKLGLYVGRGPQHSGEIRVESIGMDDTVVDATVWGFDHTDKVHVPRRKVGSHKNENGRLLVLGGSLTFPMAPVMSALAAHRAGAGYVTISFPRSLLGAVASQILEQTLLPLPEAQVGTLGLESVRDAADGAEGYKALVVGNGIGREDETVAFVLQLFGVEAPGQRHGIGFHSVSGMPATTETNQLPPTVVDGDALYALSTSERWWGKTKAVSLLTPHPGEMGHLLNIKASEVEADRIHLAREAASRWGRTVLLKGAYPLVAEPDGKVYVLTTSHSELGTAGSGDVLAGLCGFLLSLGLTPGDAARAALSIGSLAATIASEVVGPDCVAPSDLIVSLPEARLRYGS